MKSNVESFDDIVFENRNKAYGAYELRKKYSKRGSVSLIIAVTIAFLAVGIPLIANIMGEKHNRDVIYTGDGTWGLENMDDKETPPPPPPPPAPPVTANDARFKQPTIVDSLTNEEAELQSIDVLAGSANSTPVDTFSSKKIEIVAVKEPIGNEVFESFSIQEKPVYPDGEAALIRYVAEHTKYPVPAQEQGIEGTVYIRFVVTKTGDIGNAMVMRGVDQLLDDEALRVVKTLPKWTPGKNNGVPVNVWFIIPVKFKLQ